MSRLTELIKYYQQSVKYLAKSWDVTTRHMEMGEIRQHREHCQIEDDTLTFLIELQKYKDLEEQGRLIEQKHGWWKIIGMRPAGTHLTHYCSICGGHGDNEMDYCPNCGAKMDEVENER